VLPDVRLAGVNVWVAMSTAAAFDAELNTRLGLDPLHRVESIAFQDRPAYWISNGRPRFRPPR